MNKYNDKRLILKENVPLDKPLSIFIEPTNLCTFKCTFCPIGSNDYKKRAGGYFKLNTDTYIKLVEMIKEDFGRIKRLNLYMLGEPFINKNLIKFVRIAKHFDIAERVVIVSNGSLLNESWFTEIIDSGLDFLVISIYGYDETTFKQLTRSKFNLSNIIENIRKLKQLRDTSYKTSPTIVASIFKERKMNKVIERVSDIVDEIWLQNAVDWTDEVGKYTSSLEIEIPTKEVKTCGAAFYQMVIHSDLKVSICCNDWAKRLIIGDLNKERPKDIWNGYEAQKIRKTILEFGYKKITACASCITPLYQSPTDILDDLTLEEYNNRLKKLEKA